MDIVPYVFLSEPLTGNAAILKLFEGEPDHLIPSVSEELIENNMFTVAGRMIGHSFLHSGPSFPGLSPAIIHVLLAGSLEKTPVTIRDCPDLDVRETLKMVKKQKHCWLYLQVEGFIRPFTQCCELKGLIEVRKEFYLSFLLIPA